MKQFLLTVFLLSGGALAQTVSVVYFNDNSASTEYRWLSKGLADMLTTDLAKISSLKVVQREQLEKVLKEQALGLSGTLAPNTAAQLGKILGADRIITGSYSVLGKLLRVDAQLIDATTGQVLGGVSGEGSVDSVFALEKQLALTLMGKLGASPSGEELANLLQVPTKNNRALELNYLGLTQLEAGDVKAATETLKKSLEQDPNYASAKKNLTTANTVAGGSLVNQVILTQDLQKQEMAALQKLIELERIQGFSFEFKSGDSEAMSGKPGWATYRFSYAFKRNPEFLKQWVQTMQPFSREGKNRREMIVFVKGIGRGDQKSLYLSDATYGAWANRSLYPLLSFKSSNGVVAYNTESIRDSLGRELSSIKNTCDLNDDCTKYSTRFQSTYMEIPLNLLSNIKSVDFQFSNQYYKIGGHCYECNENFIYIDRDSAKDLGIPEGYLFISDERCEVEKFSNVDGVKSSNDIKKLNNCLVYTKANDLPFNFDTFQALFNSGVQTIITYYEMSGSATKTFTATLVLETKDTFSGKNMPFIIPFLVVAGNQKYSRRFFYDNVTKTNVY